MQRQMQILSHKYADAEHNIPKYIETCGDTTHTERTRQIPQKEEEIERAQRQTDAETSQTEATTDTAVAIIKSTETNTISNSTEK